METEIYTIPTRRPRTRGEIRQRRKIRKLMIASSVLVVLALVVGIIIGSRYTAAQTLEPEPAPAPVPTEQMTSKLDFPSAEVLYAIAAMEQVQPEQVSCVPEWDVETVEAIAKTVWGEARGCTTTEQAAVIWCILNRADSELQYFPDEPLLVVQQSGQFDGYNPGNPTEPEIVTLVEDVLARWGQEKAGEDDVGRVLPQDYLYFEGDGASNHFRREYIKTGETWDWGLVSPYEK